MNLSRLALVSCVLALCTASAQAQYMYPQYRANNAGLTYANAGYRNPAYADGGQTADGNAEGEYADDGYADGDYGGGDYGNGNYCDDGDDGYGRRRGCRLFNGGSIGALFSQRRGLFYGSVEALELRRDNQTATRTIVVDNVGAELFNTRSLAFDVMIGQRYTAGYMFDEQTAIEATYFSIDNWSYKGLINPAPGAGIVYLPNPLAAASFDYQGAENLQMNYSARLLNAELNVIYPLAWPDIGFLGGFRYLQLNEQFNFHSLHVDQTFVGLESSDYNTKTTNNLYGGQFGTRIRKQWDLVGIECTAKAGLYNNDSRQQNYVLDQNNTVFLRPLRGGNTHSAAFVGDINLSATYRFNPSLLLRFGYNVLWVERVALAPDQLSFTDPSLATSGTGINHRGGVFAHGMNAGFEVRF